MKKTWTGWVPFYCSVKVTVDAETESEARKKIEREAHPFLCHYCANGIEMGDPTEQSEIEVCEGDE